MKWRMLMTLGLAELLGMGLWFSATAVTPTLAVEWGLSEEDQAWLTMSVQVGFVLGTFLSAVLNLSDIFNPRHLFALCALSGAFCNAAIGLWMDSLEPALCLRFLTGLFLAGVYPPGMKIIATWFKEDRGLAIGVLVGALTVGSASPHLLKLLGGQDWRLLMYLSSTASVAAGLICTFLVTDGPYLGQKARFDWRYIARALSDRGIRLANLGYLGHMWELYAVWTWMSIFLLASFSASQVPDPATWSAAATFAIIAVGGISSVVAGRLADRWGRTLIAIVAMLASAGCCLLAGLLFGGPAVALLAVCLLWGFAVIADSAQFSAAVTELSDPAYVGTALTLQVCMGFTLSVFTIRLVPLLVDWFGWEWAFSSLAIGPLLGSWAMLRLRRSPAAAQLGGERA